MGWRPGKIIGGFLSNISGKDRRQEREIQGQLTENRENRAFVSKENAANRDLTKSENKANREH